MTRTSNPLAVSEIAFSSDFTKYLASVFRICSLELQFVICVLLFIARKNNKKAVAKEIGSTRIIINLLIPRPFLLKFITHYGLRKGVPFKLNY